MMTTTRNRQRNIEVFKTGITKRTTTKRDTINEINCVCLYRREIFGAVLDCIVQMIRTDLQTGTCLYNANVVVVVVVDVIDPKVY